MSIVDVIVPNVPTGDQIDSFVGIPSDGEDGQVLTKVSSTPFQAEWRDPTGGGGSAPVELDAFFSNNFSESGLSGSAVVSCTRYGNLVSAQIEVSVNIGSHTVAASAIKVCDIPLEFSSSGAIILNAQRRMQKDHDQPYVPQWAELYMTNDGVYFNIFNFTSSATTESVLFHANAVYENTRTPPEE